MEIYKPFFLRKNILVVVVHKRLDIMTVKLWDLFPLHICCFILFPMFQYGFTNKDVTTPSNNNVMDYLKLFNLQKNNFTNNRIVGGIQGQIHEFPSIVTVTTKNEFCAGSIITHEWIVTAAHCARHSPQVYKITGNIYNIHEINGEEVTREVSKIVQHPKFDLKTGVNDIALMMLSSPFIFNKNIDSIPLAPSNFIVGRHGIVIGWGHEGGHTIHQPNIIRKLQIPIISNDECQKIFDEREIEEIINVNIQDSVICAGKIGESACYGDSGGPFLCPKDSQENGWLCGIVSYGKKCGDIGIYTRVSSFNDWIYNVTGKCHSNKLILN